LFEIGESDPDPISLIAKLGGFTQQLQVKGDLFDEARRFELKRPLVTPSSTQRKETKVRVYAWGGLVGLPAYHPL
jgi:hypothetical protein